MPIKKQSSLITFLPIVISAFYWCFLYFNASPQIIFDAIGIETSAQKIHSLGWQSYFIEEPPREPVYPFLISFSMRLADVFAVPYLKIQIFIQLLIMFITQILLLNLLKKLKIHESIIFGTVLYFGISPAMINSAFSLFTEIAAYPFVFAILFASFLAWRKIKTATSAQSILYAFLLGVSFVLSTFVKAIFSYILILFLIPFFIRAVLFFIHKNNLALRNSFIVIIGSAITLNMFMIPYKNLNKKLNGNYVFTSRGPWLLFGNTAKRVQDITVKDIAVNAVFTLGDHLCFDIFHAPCGKWNLPMVENLGNMKRDELKKSICNNSCLTSQIQIDSGLMKESLKITLQKPIQYGLFYTIEAFKIFFWESTRIGCVTYPGWLENIYENKLFKNLLRLLISLLSMISFFYLIKQLWENRHPIFNPQPDFQPEIIYKTLIVTLILSFLLIQNFFYILARYVFPIAPLFLICIAVFLNDLCKKGDRHLN